MYEISWWEDGLDCSCGRHAAEVGAMVARLVERGAAEIYVVKVTQ